MGINWTATSIRWQPHVDKDGRRLSLAHLSPFSFELHLGPHHGQPARTITVNVGFALHVFTCDVADAGPAPEIYGDAREIRAFDIDRYIRSYRLPAIVRQLDKRKCYFAGRQNYFTLGAQDGLAGHEYRAFFGVRRKDANTVELVVQSAYTVRKDEIPKGRRLKVVRFRVIASEALHGRQPKQPP